MRKRTRSLTEEQKAFIVTRWAMFDAPREIMAALREEWPTIDVTDEMIRAYRCDKLIGKKIARKWQELFAVTRESFINEMASHPVAHRSHRVALLGKIVDTAMSKGNYKLAQSAMEQAAKEVGNAFTNEVNVKSNVVHSGTIDLQSQEDRLNFVRDRIEAALDDAKHRAKANTKH